ncbi:nuclear transport factor 2 family protein [Mycolicibacterium stellerae]|uniref:nuclear transport factor 2 family protein n=1 Tax=Mycolicibacterium stellerae TaxID=2358193 RepID=UPI000F0BB9CE|nr:nuclear transport factor 2 family protein [Mycolicibacterium stellerae]
MSKLLDLVKKHAAAEDIQDIDTTMSTFTENCVYTIPAIGLNMHGKREVRAHYENTFATFPDFRTVDSMWWDLETDVFLRCQIEGTISGVEWNGYEPPPEKVGTKMTFWTFTRFPRAEDGLLLGEEVWLNGNELLANFGVLPSADAFEVAKAYQIPRLGAG